jgi:hypothetical protein
MPNWRCFFGLHNWWYYNLCSPARRACNRCDRVFIKLDGQWEEEQ